MSKKLWVQGWLEVSEERPIAEVPVAPGQPSAPDAPPGQEIEPVPKFDATAFYDSIRETLFGGSLSQEQVDGHNLIGQVCASSGLDPIIEQTAYVLATVYHETARTMQPIEEYGGWNTRYAPWFGRGHVQLTWEENYARQQAKLGSDPIVIERGIPYQVHDDYELALLPTTSALICVWGMRDGDFTNVKLRDHIRHGSVDYFNARRIVNGTDRAEEIAGYAALYEAALRDGYAGLDR